MKTIITALVLVLFTTLSFSQDVKYGVRGGFNISNLDFDPDATFENKHRNSFAFGGFVDFGLGEKFSILTELQYSAEGGGKDESLRANFVQVPVLVRVKIGDSFLIGAGPQLSLKSWFHEDGIKNLTFSVVGGVEYMLNDELFIDARYTYGLSNILDGNAAGLEAKNTNIQIGFGIKI
ncbi:porin family protein [Ichthyenterobacterium magnum]|uniref:Outer membrane protein with beta-barrel domain n=1 Tax=Ichthyenterobacterium magnum TaxID=1230530 RepID=A0A420DKL3_9FLAO|nr:porin family protein [Ichthyenterobacterium magnum]RKE94697.1 outer membrane protein with beta-barrel domain [Ichthyenterobacterium magnum]